jgi:hypothetical protein
VRGGRERTRWQRRVDEVAAARERGEIGDDGWFVGMGEVFEGAYLAGDNPGHSPGSAVTRRAGRRAGARSSRRSTVTAASSTSAARAATCSSASSSGRRIGSSRSASSRRASPSSPGGDCRSWPTASTSATPSCGSRRGGSTSSAPSSSTCRPTVAPTTSTGLLSAVVAPGGRLIVFGYGSPRSHVLAEPVGEILRGLGFEPELEFAAEAPEGGAAIVELAALRAG